MVLNIYCLPRCDGVLLGKWFPEFWRWKCYDALKYCKLLIQQHGIISQKTLRFTKMIMFTLWLQLTYGLDISWLSFCCPTGSRSIWLLKSLHIDSKACSFHEGKETNAWNWPLTPIKCWGEECVELYPTSLCAIMKCTGTSPSRLEKICCNGL